MLDNIDDFESRVRMRAFQLWQGAGSPNGREDEFWHRAREIEGESLSKEEKKVSDPSEPNDPSSIAEF